jgi:hypothetical protein
MGGPSNEALMDQRRAVAAVFSEASDLLRTLTVAQDYFVGYTTIEAIDERISEIGDPSDTTGKLHRGRLTRLDALKAFKDTVLSNIAAARELGALDVKQYDSVATVSEENPKVVT